MLLCMLCRFSNFHLLLLPFNPLTTCVSATIFFSPVSHTHAHMFVLFCSLLTHEQHMAELSALTDDSPLCSYLPPFITHPHRLAPSLCISPLTLTAFFVPAPPSTGTTTDLGCCKNANSDSKDANPCWESITVPPVFNKLCGWRCLT